MIDGSVKKVKKKKGFWPIYIQLLLLICFILTYYLYVLDNMGCAAAYFLPIPSTERRISVRSDFLNVSLVLLRAKFYTARHISCLYKIDLVSFIIYIKNKASYQVIL